jgi:hypothetical protein
MAMQTEDVYPKAASTTVEKIQPSYGKALGNNCPIEIQKTKEQHSGSANSFLSDKEE